MYQKVKYRVLNVLALSLMFCALPFFYVGFIFAKPGIALMEFLGNLKRKK